MDGWIRISITNKCAHVQSDNIVLGESLFVPRVFAFTLSIVHLFVLNCLELVHQLLLFGVHVKISLRWVNPHIRVFSHFEKFFIREVPVQSVTSPGIAGTEALGAGNDVCTTMMSEFTVESTVPSWTRCDRPSVVDVDIKPTQVEPLRPEHSLFSSSGRSAVKAAALRAEQSYRSSVSATISLANPSRLNKAL